MSNIEIIVVLDSIRFIYLPPERRKIMCDALKLAMEKLRAEQEHTENKPLTPDEMNALDHEPIYVLHTGGKWTMNGWHMNGWHIATASSYQNHGRCDLEIDNGNTIIDMQNYGKTWLAYRTKPERSEG